MPRYNTSLATNSLTGSATISSPYNGAFTELTGTAPYTVTLPNPVLYPGSNQTFYNATSGTITLTTPNGSFNGTGGPGTSSITAAAGQVVSVTSDGTNYIVISEDGSPLIATTGLFSSDVTINGASATVSITPSSLTLYPAATGSVDRVNIGVNTRGTGAFTTLAANGQVTFTGNVTSSGTSSGTIVVTGGVGVSGTINASSVVATGLTGTLQTASQTNITSVGTLGSLSVSGTTSTGTITVSNSGAGVARFTSTGSYVRPVIETTGTTGALETSLHFTQAQAAGGTKDYYMGIYQPTSGRSRFYIDNRTSLPTDFEVGGAPKVTITTAGELLVGTQSSTELLTIAGSIRTTSDNSCITAGNDGNIGFVKKAGYDGHIGVNSAAPLIFSRLSTTTITGANVASGSLTEMARFTTGNRFKVGTQAENTVGTSSTSSNIQVSTLNIVRSANETMYMRDEGGSGNFTIQTYNSGNTGELRLNPFGGTASIGNANIAGNQSTSSYTHFERTNSPQTITRNNWGKSSSINPGDDQGASFRRPYVVDFYTPNTESNSANTYYPVSFNTPDNATGMALAGNLWITRRYWDTGPAQRGGSSIGWNDSSTHQGGLEAHFYITGVAWSDYYNARLAFYRYTYHNTISDYGMMLTSDSRFGSGAFWVRLRGGFYYRIYSSFPVSPANVTPGGTVFYYPSEGNTYQTWPATVTSVQNTNFNSNQWGGTL